jgi:hypothetical protein
MKFYGLRAWTHCSQYSTTLPLERIYLSKNCHRKTHGIKFRIDSLSEQVQSAPTNLFQWSQDAMNTDELDTNIGVAIWVSSSLGTTGIIGWQVYKYMRIGEWYPLSVISALRWCNVQWSFFPTEWFGLYKILDYLPLSVATIIVCIISLYWLETKNR